MSFFIGNVKINGPLVVAPMAGISNITFMKICEDMGANYVITELISSEAIIRDNQKTFNMLKGLDELKIPFAIQLFGSDPKVMGKAAKKVNELYPKAIIDINMGCPVPKVAIKGDAGSALMKNPDLAYNIVKEVVDSVDVPVTVKIRLGWDEKSINYLEIAKLVQKGGASAITLHARTRKEGYSGKADWEHIKILKENIDIPVIGNGDIKSPLDAKKMLDETKCDAIMIGRGLLGNPWLLKSIKEYLNNGNILPEVTYEDKIGMMKKHLINLCETEGEKLAILEIRTHFLYYLKGMPQNGDIKNKICKANSKEEIIKILDNYLHFLCKT